MAECWRRRLLRRATREYNVRVSSLGCKTRLWRTLCCSVCRAVGGALLVGLLLPAVNGQEIIPSEPVHIATKAGVPTQLEGKLAWQIALEREGFSPGLIDGKPGGRTKLATTFFQGLHGLPKTGVLDEATLEALKPDPPSAITTYAVAPADLEGITPFTDDWNQRAMQKRMGYYNVLDGLSEKFHTSVGVMKSLNPGVDFEALSAGTALRVPGIVEGVAPKAAGLTVDLPRKLIMATSAEGKVIGLFHCSIAAKVEKRPSGQTTVICNNPNPDYTFDPKNWPDVSNVDHKLIIPPGPRNPVGLCWIGLDLPGYGMHGTPWPELIGKTGSHGCFRMANWDAVRLSRMIRVGATVMFIGEGDSNATASGR
jgi:lipoprotein-anchoring transpeptidase ErfK/SrfK